MVQLHQSVLTLHSAGQGTLGTRGHCVHVPTNPARYLTAMQLPRKYADVAIVVVIVLQ